MMRRLWILIVLWLSDGALTATAFSPPRPMTTQPQQQQQRLSTVLFVSQTMRWDHFPDDRYLVNKAREVAFSDTSTVTEAKQFLRSILEFESACVSGVLVGNEVCDDVTEMADIVAHLREKVDHAGLEDETTRIARPVPTYAVAAVPVLLLTLFAAFVLFSASMGWQFWNNVNNDAVPFETQEWIWAAQGGYLDTMTTHYLHNGGL